MEIKAIPWNHCKLEYLVSIVDNMYIIFQIVLGAIILLKLSDFDAPNRIIEILELAVSNSALNLQLKESLEFNKQLMGEFEKVVKDKLIGEEELYTKFRILLNKFKARD